ncbi:hypothetical protein CFBP3846_01320 [Pseudomonas syringae pv. avii]|uniref:Secreted protein n=2 Tax=Pseudomonas syringae group TaxID=136849 RepID=A0ABY1U2Z3_PSESX|nr:hypothetical protein NCPPB2254_01207 [Pseudomonas syringae pv. persicae]SOQ07395.1 hypothetical protein CFBP1573P_01432 [Pseudomonas syringae pv. persicae]SOS25755.1 hypothetical protein CFBP3846_01320 [Pseudomonas syringae pv. avii]
MGRLGLGHEGFPIGLRLQNQKPCEMHHRFKHYRRPRPKL